jgi:predicted RND superfamily exporter protein
MVSTDTGERTVLDHAMRSAFLENRGTALHLAIGGLLLLATAGLFRLQAQADYRVYFSPNDPLLALQASVNQRFSLSDSAVLILEAGELGLLAPGAMAAYRRLERELRNLEYVKEVAGFYRFVPAVEDIAGEDGQDLFAPAGSEREAISAEGLMQALLKHPRGRDLVSADQRFGLLEVQVQLPGRDSASEVQQAMAAIRTQAGEILLDTGVVASISYSGALALNQAYIDVVRHDLRVFIPGLITLIAVVLYAVFRWWRLVILPLAGGLAAAAAAMGLAGWLGWTLAAINAFTPIIIVSLHLAASMHLIVSFVQRRAGGESAQAAMNASLSFNLPAMSLSALTTAAGFLLLALSPSPPVRIVGYCVAIGVGASWLINILLLPRQLSRLDTVAGRWQSIGARLDWAPMVRGLRRWRYLVLALALGCSLAALLTLPGVRIDDNVYNYFPEEHTFSQGSRQLDRQFGGSVRLSYVLDSGEPRGALDEEFADLEFAFLDWLLAQPEVGGVVDIYQLMQRRGMNLDQARQYLHRHSVTGLGIQRQLTPELGASRVEVLLPALTSKSLIDFDQRARAWLGSHAGAFGYEGGIGPDLIFAWLGQRNATSMFVSLGIALVGVGLLIGLIFRSREMAILGLACNLLPLLLVYALWIAVGGYISLGAAVVLGMIMGVIVDDTLHLLCKYRGLARQGDADPVLALGRQVLPAVVVTSVTLAMGLSIGMLSDFRPLRELSLLSAGVILAALLVDALLLPALLMMRRNQDA